MVEAAIRLISALKLKVTDMEHYYAVILAGGGGTRLWPMSRADVPKQLLPLVEESSMFRVSVERLAPLFTPDQIYVVTGAKYVEAMRADAPEIPAENFIAEPYGKNTAPAAALAVTVIHKRDPQATIALLTADHHIAYKERFRRVLRSGVCNWRRMITSSRWGFRRRCPRPASATSGAAEQMRDHRRVCLLSNRAGSPKSRIRKPP